MTEIFKEYSFPIFFACLLVVVIWIMNLMNKRLDLKDDNPIEEAVETVIEKETGIKIDITPNSKE